jgi:hypothetical protein
MENGPFIGDLPIQIMIFHSYVNVYQRVCHKYLSLYPNVVTNSVHIVSQWNLTIAEGC